MKPLFFFPKAATRGQLAVRLPLAFAAIALCSPLLVSVGCGGSAGGDPSTTHATSRKTGGLSLSVTWPERTRLIPDASESIVVTVLKAGASLRTATLTRPAAGQPLTTTASFDDLPVGTDYVVTAAAFPVPGGTGVAQARSSMTFAFAVTDNVRTPVSVTMDSTIVKLALQPLLLFPLGAGRTQTFSLVATDAQGNIVLTSPRKLNFNLAQDTAGTATLTQDALTSSATLAVVAPPANGRVKLTITATDTESGKIATEDVYVNAVGLAADATWAKFHGDVHNTGRLAQMLTPPVGGTATVFATVASQIVFSSPVIDKSGNVYIGAYDKNIYAFDKNGNKLWSVATGDIIESTPALSKDGALYVGSNDGKLYCIETSTGAVRYTVPVDGSIYGSPVIGDNGIVYFATTDPGSSVYAIDALSGVIKWKQAVPGAGVQTTPALSLDGSVLYFGANSGMVYAKNVTDGSDAHTAFQADAEVYTSSCMVGDDGTVYFGTLGGKLYALNADLTPKWASPYDTGAPIYGTPAISSDGSTVYVGNLDNFSGLNTNKLTAVNTAGGDNKWEFVTGDGITASAAVGSDDTIYVTSFDSNLYALNPDGSLKSKTPIAAAAGTAVESSPGFGPDGAIYFGSTDGTIQVVR